MNKKERSFKNAVILAAYLLLFWGFYRLLFQLPEEIEEVLIKPVLWLGPMFFLLKKEGEKVTSLGINGNNLFPSIYMSLAIGSFFVLEAVIANYAKYGVLNFGSNIGSNSLLISFLITFATAISEELVFRGYIFPRIWRALDNEILGNIFTSLIWVLVHVPIVVFVWKYGPIEAIVYLFLTFVFGVGSAFVFARTKNISSSILLHVLWQWPIILFR